MDAAFDGPEGEDDESHALLDRRDIAPRIPGDYDFERDYVSAMTRSDGRPHADRKTQPPPSPPPFQPYSAENPAPGNTNGVVPTNVQRPAPQRHFLGGILPTSFLPRQQAPRVVGANNTGVFANLSARPDGEVANDNTNYAAEDEEKDGPPSYQTALRDAVPPYWETTVVLPSSNSPFGPLSSSMSGDELLIDGMPSGNFFTFAWNVLVSVSFQFVGFLLTYVLHTTHAAKYGSRVGLGMTMIQFGFTLRSKAEELIETGRFPVDSNDPIPVGASEDELQAENALEAFLGGLPWPQPVHDPALPPDAPPVVLHNTHEAELFAEAHNMTLTEMFHLPTAADVGRANEYFSFFLMTIGWFIVLTSVGGWWRVKRFENGLRAAQRESERAQAEANGETLEADDQNATSNSEPGPTSLAYYTTPLRQAAEGMNHIRRGFFGMHGRRLGGRGNGHTPLPQDDEHELLDAQGFGLAPMAGEEDDQPRSRRGLWGV